MRSHLGLEFLEGKQKGVWFKGGGGGHSPTLESLLHHLEIYPRSIMYGRQLMPTWEEITQTQYTRITSNLGCSLSTWWSVGTGGCCCHSNRNIEFSVSWTSAAECGTRHSATNMRWKFLSRQTRKKNSYLLERFWISVVPFLHFMKCSSLISAHSWLGEGSTSISSYSWLSVEVFYNFQILFILLVNCTASL